MDIHKLFDEVIERKASDLHLIVGYHPSLRINSEIYQVRNTHPLTDEETKQLVLSMLTEEQKENLFANREIDIGYDYKGYRFRCNIYYSRSAITAACRLIDKIKPLNELNLPNIFQEFITLRQGLILITGPTGVGKSTTLAAIINEINLTGSKHIITIEDPIEYIYPVAKSIISQRALRQDTHSWGIALKSVLREDPDVVLIGEMRDYETIQSVLTIAETGHLVFSTLHTSSAPESVNRIIDVFPANQQNQIKAQLASVLRAVISQKLVPNVDKTARLPVVEVLLNIPAVASVVREGRIHMLDNILMTAEHEGLLLIEKSLLNLYQKQLITRETALSFAIRQDVIKKFLK